MDLDEDELKATKSIATYKTSSLKKEEIAHIIRHRLWEMDYEEWDIPHGKEIKFNCKEELEIILFRLLKKGE